MIASLTKALPQLLLALALLALAAILGARHTLSSAEAYALVLAVVGGGAVAAGVVLGSVTTSNSGVAPHLVLVLGALAVAAVLGALGVFSSTQVFGVVAVVVGGGALAAGNAQAAPSTPSAQLAQAQDLIDQAKAAQKPPAPPAG